MTNYEQAAEEYRKTVEPVMHSDEWRTELYSYDSRRTGLPTATYRTVDGETTKANLLWHESAHGNDSGCGEEGASEMTLGLLLRALRKCEEESGMLAEHYIFCNAYPCKEDAQRDSEKRKRLADKIQSKIQREYVIVKIPKHGRLGGIDRSKEGREFFKI